MTATGDFLAFQATSCLYYLDYLTTTILVLVLLHSQLRLRPLKLTTIKKSINVAGHFLGILPDEPMPSLWVQDQLRILNLLQQLKSRKSPWSSVWNHQPSLCDTTFVSIRSASEIQPLLGASPSCADKWSRNLIHS